MHIASPASAAVDLACWHLGHLTLQRGCMSESRDVLAPCVGHQLRRPQPPKTLPERNDMFASAPSSCLWGEALARSKLSLFSDAFERLSRRFDAVEQVAAFRRK